MGKPAILIEMEGVLINDPMLRFWDLIGPVVGMTEADMALTFELEIGHGYWRGETPETKLWKWLGANYPQIDPNAYRRILLGRVFPLIGMHLLPRLGAQADVYVMSDLRREWVLKLFNEEDLGYLLKGLWFSDHTGYTMRDEDLWRRLAKAMPANRLLIHRDPQVGKLAEKSGFAFIQADPQLIWADGTLEWLNRRSARIDWRGWVRKAPGWLTRISRTLKR